MTPAENLRTPLSMASLEEPSFRDNPYPFYSLLRENDPVHWDEYWNAWIVSRYADVTALLRDERLSARVHDGRAGDAPPGIRVEAEIVSRAHARKVLFVDPPLHTRLRGLMNRAFTPRAVERLRGTIAHIAGGIMDRAAEAGRLDVIGDLAFPLPALVIAEMLGVPREDRERFKGWSTDMALDFGVPWSTRGALLEAKVRAQQGVIKLHEYMRQLVEERSLRRHDDLLQMLIDAREGEGGISDEELAANSAFLLFAGHETTTNLIGNGMLALLRAPGEMEMLRLQPDLVTGAVEEFLRYDAPIQFASRQAIEDIETGGGKIEVGRRIRFCLGAANRDPAQFSDPDRLDIRRRPNRQLAFSHGIHFCLGAALARLEGEVVFTMCLQHFGKFDLLVENPRRRENPDFRGLEELPVAVG